MTDAASPVDRLIALLSKKGLHGSFNPASARQIAEANAVAPLPDPMTRLYLTVDAIRFGQVEPFMIDDYIDVNSDRDPDGELARMVFVASDLAAGWFFVDPVDALGLGAGFTFWVDRGSQAADDCIPAAPSLIDLFEEAEAGGRPWQGPMLGDRAVQRLTDLLSRSKAVATRPPVDPALFHAPGQMPLPLRLGDIYMASNGFLLVGSGREFTAMQAATAVPGTDAGFGHPGAVWIGTGPGGVRYATTTGIGWRGLPADRMLAIAPDQSPEDAPVLGRTADVWSRWIAEEEEAM